MHLQITVLFPAPSLTSVGFESRWVDPARQAGVTTVADWFVKVGAAAPETSFDQRLIGLWGGDESRIDEGIGCKHIR